MKQVYRSIYPEGRFSLATILISMMLFGILLLGYSPKSYSFTFNRYGRIAYRNSHSGYGSRNMTISVDPAVAGWTLHFNPSPP
jgi:hypothetical protein